MFPDSDGKPMSDNTIQYRWIVTIKGNLDLLYKDTPDVFVAGDLLWYAKHEEGTPRQAPDVMVVFGRLKGDRGSWQPWKENDTTPQVVFEIMSPSNRAGEMTRKFEFYDRYGVDEYYIYDPKDGDLSIWVRSTGDAAVDGAANPGAVSQNRLRAVNYQDEYTSPLMGVRFAPRHNAEMTIWYPDGRRFLTMDETDAAREQAEAEARRAEANAQRAEANAQRAEANAQRAEAERDSAGARADRLAAKLSELGVDPDGI